MNETRSRVASRPVLVALIACVGVAAAGAGTSSAGNADKAVHT